MSRPGVLSGPKFSTSHQTYIKDALDILTWLKNHDGVKKVILGHIKRVPSSKRRLTLKENTITVRGVSELQLIHVVGLETPGVREDVQRYISKFNKG